MASPAKKRKLNSDSKSSPTAARNLDYFFGKQRQNVPSRPANSDEQRDHEPVGSSLTDEELARKLQAEWDQEDVGRDEAADDEARESNAGQESSVAEAPPESGKASRTEGISDGNDGNNQSSGGEPKQVNPMASTATKNNNTLSLQAAGSAEDTITSNIPFDESPLTFDPAKYIGDLQGHWAAEGGNASYALLTRCFVLVNSTQSRIKIVDTLVNLLRVLVEGDPSSLLPTVRINKLPSSFES
jgi:DNA ligase-1